MKKILKNIFTILFIIISVWILILNLYVTITNHNILSIVLIIPILIFLYFIINKIKAIKIKQKKFWITFSCIITLIFIIIIGLETRVELGWDYGRVIRTAYDMEKGNNILRSYFAMYPNNLMLLFIENIIAKIVIFLKPSISLGGFKCALILVNALIVFANLFMINYLVKNKFGKKAVIVSSILSILYCPLYLYTAILYTDTIGMFLSLFALLLYYFYDKSKNQKAKNILFFLIILLITIGFKIKATNLFIIIALMVEFFFEKKYKQIIISILVFIVLIIPVNLLNNQVLKLTEEEMESYNFPYTHWVMMSLNPNSQGGFNADDLFFTQKFTTIESKKKANIEVLKRRIEDYGPKGLANRMFITKSIRTWTNPSLSTEDYLERNKIKRNIINESVTTHGKYYKFYNIYITSIYLILILGLVISGYYELKKHNNFIFISQLLIMGFFIFELVWECNSRYLVSFIPYILIPASVSYTNIFNKIEERKK